MNRFEKWRPGKTLIGWGDNGQHGPTLIQDMATFHRFAREAAHRADLAISNAMLGLTSTRPGPVNCRSVPLPLAVQASCKYCGHEAIYHANPNGGYACPSCAKKGLMP